MSEKNALESISQSAMERSEKVLQKASQESQKSLEGYFRDPWWDNFAMCVLLLFRAGLRSDQISQGSFKVSLLVVFNNCSPVPGGYLKVSGSYLLIPGG